LIGYHEVHPGRESTPLFVSCLVFHQLGSNGFVSSGTAGFSLSPFLSLDDDSFCRQLMFERSILFRHLIQIAVNFSSVSNVALQQLGDLA
jgi:hypothetical protein